jgi:hypothetical protein
VNDPLRALNDVLAQERHAAARADVDRLLILQDDKRVALEAVRALKLPPAELAQVAEAARSNLVLLRQLVSCLRAMAGHEPPTYGPSGSTADDGPRTLRGCG